MMTIFLYTFLWYTFLLFLFSLQSNHLHFSFRAFLSIFIFNIFLPGNIPPHFIYFFHLLELYLCNKYLSISHLLKYHARITQLAFSRSLFPLHRLIASTVSISYKFTRQWFCLLVEFCFCFSNNQQKYYFLGFSTFWMSLILWNTINRLLIYGISVISGFGSHW